MYEWDVTHKIKFYCKIKISAIIHQNNLTEHSVNNVILSFENKEHETLT